MIENKGIEESLLVKDGPESSQVQDKTTADVVVPAVTLTAILFMLMGSTSMGSMNVAAKFVSSETQVTLF